MVKRLKDAGPSEEPHREQLDCRTHVMKQHCSSHCSSCRVHLRVCSSATAKPKPQHFSIPQPLLCQQHSSISKALARACSASRQIFL